MASGRPDRGLPYNPSAMTASSLPDNTTPHAAPEIVLYGRRACGLCDEARMLLEGLLDERRAAGLSTPTLVERDIDTDPAWERAYFATIPVVELGDRRLELVTSAAKLRRLLHEALDAEATSTAR